MTKSGEQKNEIEQNLLWLYVAEACPMSKHWTSYHMEVDIPSKHWTFNLSL